MEIRKFNKKGAEKFKKEIDRMCYEGNLNFKDTQFDSSILDEKYSKKLNLDKVIDMDGEKEFKNKLDMCKYLYEKLKPYLTKYANEIYSDKHKYFWDWLSAFYIEKLWGTRFGADSFLYTLNSETSTWDTYHANHLLMQPFRIFALHQEKAEYLLGGSIHERGDMLMRLANAPVAARNGNFILVGRMINEKNKFTVKKFYRYIQVFRQLNETYSLSDMNPEDVINVLPDEFKSLFKEKNCQN
tara:strand:- start:16231 stop:16956 length:726 start_codon:yes stop_codon:yes gene_type:complete